MSWILMTKENDFAINKDKQKWAVQSAWHKLIFYDKIYTRWGKPHGNWITLLTSVNMWFRPGKRGLIHLAKDASKMYGSFCFPKIRETQWNIMERGEILKESVFKSYDELPLFLNAEMVAKLLGVSPSSAYELMHEKGFPAMRVGNRLIVPKAEFQTWVQKQINK